MSEVKNPILQTIKLSKTFTTPTHIDILKGISLKVHLGESLAIMGASGEGKSTLLQILGTLESATSGQLFIGGKVASNSNAPKLRNKHIGFVFQSFHLLNDYSTLQNVLMPALIAGKKTCKNSESYQRAVMLIDKVGLSHRLHFPIKLLSGGEKQRVSIARALCNDPEILLADEPSGNLDGKTSEKIHELLLYCVEELNKALIVVTHDHDLAQLCHQTVHLRNGNLY